MADLAVALVSGGMDSAVAAALACEQGFELIALTVDYGQTTRAELTAANRVARWLKVREHRRISVDLRSFGASALLGGTPVPPAGSTPADEIPSTYVPARNTVLLSLALALAEARDAQALVIGANQVDYSGYPDCRPEFLEAFARLAAVGTKAGVEGHPPQVLAPLLELPKRAIVTEGVRLGVPFADTVSCYEPDETGAACRRCDSCHLRQAGFVAAGVADPTRYR